MNQEHILETTNKKKNEKPQRTLGRGNIKHKTLKNHITPQNPTQPNTAQHDFTSITIKTSNQKNDLSERFDHMVQIRIHKHLFESIKNSVESAIFGGNYEIESASHFLREALRDHLNGKQLKVAHENGSKKAISLKLDNDLKAFWDTLPKRHRQNILERAVRTKLQEYLT